MLLRHVWTSSFEFKFELILNHSMNTLPVFPGALILWDIYIHKKNSFLYFQITMEMVWCYKRKIQCMALWNGPYYCAMDRAIDECMAKTLQCVVGHKYNISRGTLQNHDDVSILVWPVFHLIVYLSCLWPHPLTSKHLYDPLINFHIWQVSLRLNGNDTDQK